MHGARGPLPAAGRRAADGHAGVDADAAAGAARAQRAHTRQELLPAGLRRTQVCL